MSILGIDVGGTTIKYAVCDSQGHLSHKGKVKTPDHLEAFYDAITTIAHSCDDVAGIALSMPGAVASDEGVIYGASALPYIHGPNIKKDLENRLHTRVEIENDANCAALAEVWLGAAKETQDSCFIVCGTGVGGAVVKNRQIHKGKHLHGGEFGYMIADYDLEREDFTILSDTSTLHVVEKVAKELDVSPDTLDGKEIFDHLENPVYAKYVNAFYYRLAIAIYNLQYAYDPEMIVIGGGISARDDLEEQINKRLDTILKKVAIAKVRPVVRRCQYGNDANIIGAVYHYLSQKA